MSLDGLGDNVVVHLLLPVQWDTSVQSNASLATMLRFASSGAGSRRLHKAGPLVVGRHPIVTNVDLVYFLETVKVVGLVVLTFIRKVDGVVVSDDLRRYTLGRARATKNACFYRNYKRRILLRLFCIRLVFATLRDLNMHA